MTKEALGMVLLESSPSPWSISGVQPGAESRRLPPRGP